MTYFANYILEAFKKLYAKDSYLLTSNSTEASLQFRIARYLAVKLDRKDLKIDCEYNTINVNNTIRYKECQNTQHARIDIIYHKRGTSDKNIFAINKPKGLAVQSGTKIEKSVNDYLKYLKDNNGEIPKLVHRLDKDTSGILILAKNRESADLLSNYFKNKDQNIDKIYLALVIGKFSKDQGEINIPLLKKVENGVEKVYKDEKEGKDAITLYKVIGYSTKYNVSLVEVKILTGRTHQIRVHMKEIGHPILGDGKYGSKKAFIDGLSNDMHLHAYYIKIKNFFDKDLEIKAPLSQEFKKTLNKLGIKNEYN